VIIALQVLQGIVDADHRIEAQSTERGQLQHVGNEKASAKPPFQCF